MTVSDNAETLESPEIEKKVKTFFRHHSETPDLDMEKTNLPEAVMKDVANAIIRYENLNQSDAERFKRKMLDDIQNIKGHFMALWELLIELAELSEKDNQKKQRLRRINTEIELPSLNFAQNTIIQHIRSVLPQNHVDISTINWRNHQQIISKWYHDILKKDKAYVTYQKLSQPSFKQDMEFTKHLLKGIVFKNETINAFLEEHIFYWSEDKNALKSLLLKNLKAWTQSNLSELQFELSQNWQDDKKFLIEIYGLSQKHDEEFSRLISKKAKNWDLGRIASLDKVILTMAISEFIHFHSIPVKVTINEYIEISKNYSTPKSKQFINGILDVLANELLTEGKIKKSGRGLIDNK